MLLMVWTEASFDDLILLFGFIWSSGKRGKVSTGLVWFGLSGKTG